MPAIVLLLAAVYLLTIYILLALAKRVNKVMSNSSRDIGQTSKAR